MDLSTNKAYAGLVFRRLLDKNEIIFLFLFVLGLFNGSFIVEKANRLAEGSPLALESVISATSIVLVVVIALIAVLLSRKRTLVFTNLSFLLLGLLLSFFLWQAGDYAAGVASNNDYARVSLSYGFWLLSGACYFFYIYNINFFGGVFYRFLLTISFFLPITVVLLAGFADKLSLLIEFYYNQDRFYGEVLNHFKIAYGAVVLAVITGFPLAVFITRNEKLSEKVFNVLGILQTIPSIALFGFLMIPLAFIVNMFPLLGKLGISGIGWLPAVIALYLYSLLPVVINVFTGIKSVSSDVVEAARGMGMARYQILFRIKILLSLPVILNGIRVALVQSVGNTAVAALIGAGGLGVFIFQGLGQAAPDLILLGAIPTIIIAVLADSVMQILADYTKKKTAYDKI
ncbi:MAG: ABC transporter permease [Flexistipes sinusarabici]|uniref:ABC transporter permease n=1 Tax=Flexistipes sinusarabici TaxID=2352 RepID=A0A5D0MN47_FLESI|nr:ABC transporter permease [Flexistipes sinusarabici]TYB33822.1 MAG: ABC transporter permease [Flexistipes sinusarabici]